MNTITENIQQYLETSRGTRDRDYNNILKTYLQLLSDGTIEKDDATSLLWKKIDTYIKNISTAPNSERSKELYSELLSELDVFINEHYIIFQSHQDAAPLDKLKGLQAFLQKEKEVSGSQENIEKITIILSKIDEIITFVETESQETVKPNIKQFFEKMDILYAEAIKRPRNDVANELLIQQLEEFRVLREKYERAKTELEERYKEQRCAVNGDMLCDIHEITWDDAFSLRWMYPSKVWESDPRLLEKRDEIFHLEDLSHDEILEKYSNYELPSITLDDPLPIGQHQDTVDHLFQDKNFIKKLQQKEWYTNLNLHGMKQRFIKDMMLWTQESITTIFNDLSDQIGDGWVEISFWDRGSDKKVVFENTEERDRAIAAYMLLLDGILNDPNSKFDAIFSWLTSGVTWWVDIYTLIGAFLETDSELLNGFLFLLTTGSLVYYYKNVPLNIPLTEITSLRVGFTTREWEKESDIRNDFWRWIWELDNMESWSNEYSQRVQELTKMVKWKFNLGERLEIFNYYIKHSSSANEANSIKSMRNKYLLLWSDNHFYTAIYRKLENGIAKKSIITVANKTILWALNARTHQKWWSINFWWLRKHVDKNYVANFRDYLLEKARYDSVETLLESDFINEENKTNFRNRIQQIIDDPRVTLNRKIFEQLVADIHKIQKATWDGGMLTSFKEEFQKHTNTLFGMYNNGDFPLSGDGKSSFGLDNLMSEAVEEKDNLLKVYSDRWRLPEKVRALETANAWLGEKIRNIVTVGINDIQDGGDLIKSLWNAVNNYTSERVKSRDVDFLRKIEELNTKAEKLNLSVDEEKVKADTSAETNQNSWEQTENKGDQKMNFADWVDSKIASMQQGLQNWRKTKETSTNWSEAPPTEDGKDSSTPSKDREWVGDAEFEEAWDTETSEKRVAPDEAVQESPQAKKQQAIEIFERFVLQIEDAKVMKKVSRKMIASTKAGILDGSIPVEDIESFTNGLRGQAKQIFWITLDSIKTRAELAQSFLDKNQTTLSPDELEELRKAINGESFDTEKFGSAKWMKYFKQAVKW